jgi:2-keto-4-pentenoate hydratase/2-oxohepta-3-ene-1,7-dioic acid hydratase in catechol pathway
MKFANLGGRATVITAAGGIDVERASGGRFPADPQAVFAQWSSFRAWAGALGGEKATPLDRDDLGPPAPRPTQVFGIGLNYRAHAAEAGLKVPEFPSVFTKFPTCIAGPTSDVVLPSGKVDWEVELVVVIGLYARCVSEADGWKHVAGLAVGQDLSERVVQFAGGGQFSLGKSFPGFGPTGPWLVTPDEIPDPDDLELGCRVNGEEMQKGRTSDMVLPVPRLVAELSAILPLLPGDLIFTGTPAGIGATRKPPRFLAPGDVVESWLEHVGGLRNRCLAASDPQRGPH